jgi:hypothetical protein
MSTITESIQGAATVAQVLRLLADVRRVPEWAPDVADRVEQSEAGTWLASKDGTAFGLTVQVDVTDPVEQQVARIEYLRQLPSGVVGGAEVRVRATFAGGSVITMTVPRREGVTTEAQSRGLVFELARLHEAARSA